MSKKLHMRMRTVLFCLLLSFAAILFPQAQPGPGTLRALAGSEILSEIPEYAGSPYAEINGNVPDFREEDLTAESFESYSDLDALGRCGAAYASVGEDLMPTEKRGDISEIHPTGWVQNSYGIVESGALYNRCHLLAYELTGENANEKNLITGTRYFNVEGMLPFENMITDYIKETGNHVLYRVTPIFEGENLLASGVQMEAESVEDRGEGILFHVFCYNVQPGIEIDYASGENWLSDGGEAVCDPSEDAGEEEQSYILNTNTKKFHDSDCENAKEISGKNREAFTGSRTELIAQGYEPCMSCQP